jgi:YidC/Oxa1 family membrane protein insertase
MNDQKRMFLAVILSGVILFGWQILFGPKNTQNKPSQVNNINNTSTNSSNGSNDNKVENDQNTTKSNLDAVKLSQELTTKSLEIDQSKVSISIRNDFNLIEFLSGNNKVSLNIFAGTDLPFSISKFENDKEIPIYFDIFEISDDQVFSGYDSKNDVKFSGQFDEKNLFDFELLSQTDTKYKLKFNSVVFDAKKEKIDRYHAARKFVLFNNNSTQFMALGDSEIIDAGTVKWFGIDFDYHLLAVSFMEPRSFLVEQTKDSLIAVSSNATKELKAKLIFTEKNYDFLTSLGNSLSGSVDFGIFSILAIPMLRGIQWSFDFIPNYGIAIILLTIVIRLLTFPLQIKSFKSMKKMQILQPEMAKLKEKFKDDPQRMQKETMELFKRSGANPLGGCLPLLLQMPFFFAFYQVLSNSVELVNAPFFGWIQDLSAKDPFYVLPVLMSLSWFLQQKFMPTSVSVDPVQKKIMMFMPIIFGFVMKDMPAGLTLYILVSTLLGMLQQVFVNRSTN